MSFLALEVVGEGPEAGGEESLAEGGTGGEEVAVGGFGIGEEVGVDLGEGGGNGVEGAEGVLDIEEEMADGGVAAVGFEEDGVLGEDLKKDAEGGGFGEDGVTKSKRHGNQPFRVTGYTAMG